MESLTYEVASELVAFAEVTPPLKGECWVLGRKYCLPHDKAAMTEDIRSRLWCSYRKNFRAISGTSYTTDAGWGCTLRCGQMLLGHTLICNHLGRDWRWHPQEKEEKYWKILRKFLDTRDSDYSIQMIALQGADFGRPVGQWFGPNNISQAIKKLAVHDSWSGLAVHVAMDMVVVIEDMKTLCRRPHEIPSGVKVTTESGETLHMEPMSYSRSQSTGLAAPAPPPVPADTRQHRSKTEPSTAPSLEHALGRSHEEAHVHAGSARNRKQAKSEDTSLKAGAKTSIGSSGDKSQPSSSAHSKLIESGDFMKLSMSDFRPGESSELAEAEGSEEGFRPLLLFIPLRLGQDKFNPDYTEALKACLTLPQSVGIIGGRPRHALYCIGYHGDHILYLDPHTTQQTVHIPGPAHKHASFPDVSYHCSQADRILISDLDPSLSIGFFCKDEAAIDDLCRRLHKDVLCKMRHMFEVTESRPVYWQPMEMASVASTREPFMLVTADGDGGSDSDHDGFELVDWPPAGLPPEGVL